MINKNNPNPALVERQERIKFILSLLDKTKKQGLPVSSKKLAADLGLDWGLTSKKVFEYFSQLETSGKIMLDQEAGTILKQ